MKFDKFVATRYLKAKRKQAFIGVISIITLLGITLGVAALNIALSIHNGMNRAFVESLIGKTGQLFVFSGIPGGKGFPEDDLKKVASALEMGDGVQGVSFMRVEHGVVVSTRKQMAYVKLNGIVPKDHLRASDALDNMPSGSVSSLENRGPGAFPGIILGQDLARRLGVMTGDHIRVGVPRLSSPGLVSQGFRFRNLKCEVVGIFKTGNSQFDDMDSYLLLDDLLALLNTTRIQSVLVNFKSMESMEAGKEWLSTTREMPLFAEVADLRDLNQGLLRALKMEKVATTLVISLFILIVALNMVSALTMLVMEKHRDIGIMKSFGTPKKVILKIFIRQGMTLAARGTLLGSALGVGLSLLADKTKLIKLDNNVYEVLNYLPFEVAPMEVLLTAVGSLILSYITCIYPAYQAASLNPVEALKYD